MMKNILLLLFILCTGCDSSPRPLKPPPKIVVKKIVTKFQEQYTTEDLDPAALFFDGKFRSIPKLQNRYRLYAEDGSYVEATVSLFAKTKEGQEIQAVEADWKTEE